MMSNGQHARAVRGVASLVVAAILLLATPLLAEDWTIVNLLPDGADSAQVYSVQGGYQAGVARYSFRSHAGFWNGSAGTWVDLDRPEFPMGSNAASNYGDTIGGSTGWLDDEENDYTRAALWHGSAANFTDLHPEHVPGIYQSSITSVYGAQQGGIANINEVNHAGLWSGTPESFVDLHPDGASASYIYDIGENMQVGYSPMPLSHACLWTGTAESFVDLHPAEAFASQAYGTDGDQQVGWTIYQEGGFIDHPALWDDTVESWVDLLPTGWRDGKAIDVFEGRQVGYARPSLDIEYHALVWDSEADKYTDLHQFLPEGEYIRSTAYGIWNDGVNWYVVGQGVRPGFTSAPIMWITPVPEPTSLALLLIGAAGLLRKR
jgi:hypothetical protein